MVVSSNTQVLLGLAVVAAAIGAFLFYKLVIQKAQKHAAMTSIVGNGDPTPGDGQTARQWKIGPWVFQGGARINKSKGCPETLQPLEGAIGYVDLPKSKVYGLDGGKNPISGDDTYGEPDGHIHYATFNAGPVPTTANGIEAVFRLEADDDAEVRPKTAPSGPSLISLYMQEEGEDFTGVGEKVYFRHFGGTKLIWQEGVGWHTRGEFMISLPFDIDHWGDEDSETPGVPNPPERRKQMLEQALRKNQLLGFVLGGGDGLGHGLYAVGNVRLVLVSWRYT